MTSATYSEYFWVKNETSSSGTLNIRKNNDAAPTVTVEYSTDGTTWTTKGSTSTTSMTFTLAANSKIYLRATADCWSDISSSFYYTYFSSGMNCSIGGNIMSLLWGSSFVVNNVVKKTFPNEDLKGIFNGIFYNWTNLVDAGELVLPVTHIESTSGQMGYACYRAMFERCSNLVNGPYIDLRFPENPPSGMLDRAFQRLISGCTSLKSIHINTQDYNSVYDNIFYNTTYSNLVIYDYSGAGMTSFPSGVTCNKMISLYFGYDRVTNWVRNNVEVTKVVDENSNVIIWEKPIDYTEPFYVENISSSPAEIHVRKISNRFSNNQYEGADSAPTITIEYSNDNISWNTWCNTSTTQETLTIPANSKMYFRASTNRWSYHFYWSSSNLETIAFNNITFTGTSNIDLGGNIMSLLWGGSFVGQKTFPNTSSTYIFSNVFSKESRSGETHNSIRNINKLLLPATTLTEYCYYFMFYGNTSLLNSPALPATTLARSCYSWMFRGCTSLTQAATLPATTLSQQCYNNMFGDCSSLVIAPTLPASVIPYETSTLSQNVGAYHSMFNGCTSLNEVRCYAETNTDGNGTAVWLSNVSSTGTFYKKAGVTWPSGVDGIPSGWTVVEV